MENVKIGNAESDLVDEDRLKFMLAAVEHGQLGSMYARGIEGVPRERLYPMVKLEKPGVRIPHDGIAVLHGRQDSIVQLADSQTFVERGREVIGNEGARFTVRDGEHGFDCEFRYEESWVKEALRVAVGAWVE